MSKPNWTMKMTTDPEQHTLEFHIVDNHHENSFYGEWTAKDEKELDYHMDGLQECIERGTYSSNEYLMDGERVGSWNEFTNMAHDFMKNGKQKAA